MCACRKKERRAERPSSRSQHDELSASLCRASSTLSPPSPPSSERGQNSSCVFFLLSLPSVSHRQHAIGFNHYSGDLKKAPRLGDYSYGRAMATRLPRLPATSAHKA